MRWLIASVVVLLGPEIASAHVALERPMARYSSDFQKDGPCGHPDNPPGEVVATFAPGETIAVRWNEFVPHPGHFRLALSAEGDGAFVDPVSYTDFYSAPNVLLDDIEDPNGVMIHTVELTLPEDVTCEACVLQLIQVMTDKMPWGPEGGNELYYQCADIRIVAEEDVTTSTGGAQDDESGGCTLGRRHPPSWAWLALLALFPPRRRSRSRPRSR